MSDTFRREYMGSFPDDIILKTLKKSYIAVADKDKTLFLPQNIIKNGIECIKHGAKPEDALLAVLESMGKLINELSKQAITKAMFEVKPIMKTKQSEGGE